MIIKSFKLLDEEGNTISENNQIEIEIKDGNTYVKSCIVLPGTHQAVIPCWEFVNEIQSKTGNT